MPVLPLYQSGLQTGLNDYTVSNVLAANVPEIITVPTDGASGKKANYVVFGKPAAGDFYAQAFSAQEGANRVTNGTFAEYVTNGAFSSDTGWTKGTGWTIAAGVADCDGTQTAASDLSQTLAITLIEGYTYTLTFTTASVSAGTITAYVGGTAGTARSTSATFKETFVAGSTQTLILRADADFVGTVDNVTITAWTLGTGWTTDGSTAVATGAISTAISQTAQAGYQLVEGQQYLVTYTVTRSAGSIVANVGGTAGATTSSSTTVSEVLIAGATQAISFTTTGFTGTLDNVTIYAVGSVPIDSTTGLSAQLNPTGFFLNGTAATISIVSASTPTITSSFYR